MTNNTAVFYIRYVDHDLSRTPSWNTYSEAEIVAPSVDEAVGKLTKMLNTLNYGRGWAFKVDKIVDTAYLV